MGQDAADRGRHDNPRRLETTELGEVETTEHGPIVAAATELRERVSPCARIWPLERSGAIMNR